MSRWSDEFEKHPIHETLRQAAEWLDTEIENADPSFVEEQRRLKKVLANLAEIVAGLDAEFSPLPWLDQIHEHMRHQNFYIQLQTFASTPQIVHL